MPPCEGHWLEVRSLVSRHNRATDSQGGCARRLKSLGLSFLVYKMKVISDLPPWWGRDSGWERGMKYDHRQPMPHHRKEHDCRSLHHGPLLTGCVTLGK